MPKDKFMLQIKTQITHYATDSYNTIPPTNPPPNCNTSWLRKILYIERKVILIWVEKNQNVLIPFRWEPFHCHDFTNA